MDANVEPYDEACNQRRGRPPRCEIGPVPAGEPAPPLRPLPDPHLDLRQNFCHQFFFSSNLLIRLGLVIASPLRPEDRRLILATKEREGVEGGIRNK